MPSVWSLTALYFVVCFSYNFTNSAVFTSLAWMFPKRAGPGINLVLAMFGLGSFFIPLAAQVRLNWGFRGRGPVGAMGRWLLGGGVGVWGIVH